MAATIRMAETDDSPRIAVLLGRLGYPADAGDVAARLEYWRDDPCSVLLVAQMNGVVVGVAAMHAFPLLEHSARRGRLVALVVDDAVRGEGVGRALVREAERRARDLGCRDMEVTSSRDRTAAHGFYARLEYEDSCDRAARFLKTL